MSEHKKILKESIRKALVDGLLDDKNLAYIFALEYARRLHSNDRVVGTAMQDVMGAIDIICSDDGNRQNQLEEANVNPENDENLFKITEQTIKYLESLRIRLLPLKARTNITAELGEFNQLEKDATNQETGHGSLRVLDKHWLGLYFDEGPQKKFYQTKTRGRARQWGGSPSHSVMVETTSVNFVDTDLRDTKIDLICLNLNYNFDIDQVKGCTSILHLSLTFRGCLVKNMALLFLRHINHFPGTITLKFENCEDFDETEYPYLVKELDGNNYYLNLENFALGQEQNAFEQHFDNMLQASDFYKYEHLR